MDRPVELGFPDRRVHLVLKAGLAGQALLEAPVVLDPLDL